MCSWEQTVYACGHRGGIHRMEYSCKINYRHIYGECAFNPRRDRVIQILSYVDCKDCRNVFEFVNF